MLAETVAGEQKEWDAIVITAETQEQAAACTAALRERQRRGLICGSTLLLAVPDPGLQRVGSGAATLNALLVVAEVSECPPQIVASPKTNASLLPYLMTLLC